MKNAKSKAKDKAFSSDATSAQETVAQSAVQTAQEVVDVLQTTVKTARSKRSDSSKQVAVETPPVVVPEITQTTESKKASKTASTSKKSVSVDQNPVAQKEVVPAVQPVVQATVAVQNASEKQPRRKSVLSVEKPVENKVASVTVDTKPEAKSVPKSEPKAVSKSSVKAQQPSVSSVSEVQHVQPVAVSESLKTIETPAPIQSVSVNNEMTEQLSSIRHSLEHLNSRMGQFETVSSQVGELKDNLQKTIDYVQREEKALVINNQKSAQDQKETLEKIAFTLDNSVRRSGEALVTVGRAIESIVGRLNAIEVQHRQAVIQSSIVEQAQNTAGRQELQNLTDHDARDVAITPRRQEIRDRVLNALDISDEEADQIERFEQQKKIAHPSPVSPAQPPISSHNVQDFEDHYDDEMEISQSWDNVDLDDDELDAGSLYQNHPASPASYVQPEQHPKPVAVSGQPVPSEKALNARFGTANKSHPASSSGSGIKKHTESAKPLSFDELASLATHEQAQTHNTVHDHSEDISSDETVPSSVADHHPHQVQDYDEASSAPLFENASHKTEEDKKSLNPQKAQDVISSLRSAALKSRAEGATEAPASTAKADPLFPKKDKTAVGQDKDPQEGKVDARQKKIVLRAMLVLVAIIVIILCAAILMTTLVVA